MGKFGLIASENSKKILVPIKWFKRLLNMILIIQKIFKKLFWVILGHFMPFLKNFPENGNYFDINAASFSYFFDLFTLIP